ncbi:hypothetical protein M8I34_00910 [Streptomyces sp. MCA2]|uniref:hypothetical protein n=1 Tax=Streptomyces TaxID=1883 RepID=UPI0020222D90|nr:hypothetical protein [Streptomyces sp. MCA2]MCL7490027.1 hypothetical protein [Streptomyces sp. MCA2]
MARTARQAAQAPGDRPAWQPPVAGVLFAGGFTFFALFDSQPRAWAYLAGGFACLIAFLVVMTSFSRGGGITVWPAGSYRQRAMRQLPALGAVVAGGAAGLVFDLSIGLVVAGVGLGGLTWARMAHTRNRVPA